MGHQSYGTSRDVIANNRDYISTVGRLAILLVAVTLGVLLVSTTTMLMQKSVRTV